MTMQTETLLDVITVASPCTADWEEMTGDDRVRSCAQCELNVYNLSSMSRDDAEQLLREKEGRLCVRYFKRHDGTIITRDCPVGLRAVRLRLARACAAAVALVGGLFAGTLFASPNAGKASCHKPFADLVDAITPEVEIHVEMGEMQMVMGDVAFSPQPVAVPVVAPNPPSSANSPGESGTGTAE